MTFSLTPDDGSATLPPLNSVAWDFNYDGQTFQADPTATGPTASTTFSIAGDDTVAAEVTDANGNTQIVTLDVSIDATPTSQLFITPDTDTIVAGDPLTFSITSDETLPTFTSVAWDFNYDGQSFQPDETGMATSVTTTFAAAGTQTVAAQLVDDSGTQIITFQAIIDDGPPLTAAGTLSIEADNDPIVTGDTITFYLEDAAGSPPAFSSVAWDFNYDGQTFQPSVTGTDLSTTTTFTTAGSQTVAAQVTDSSGNTEIVTLVVTIQDPPPTLTVPDDMSVEAGTPVTLNAAASANSGIASVEWQFSYDGEDFQIDPTLTTLTPTYTFPTYGEYDVWVTVTANDGQTSEAGFHVTVNEVTPTAAVSDSGPIAEGSAETFTVGEIDPDTLDTVSILVDWTGSGTFDELNPEDLIVNQDGSVSFSHVYDQNTAPENDYQAVIRVEDDGGQFTDYTETVAVTDVVPQATLTAGTQIATMASSGQVVWAVQPGQNLAWNVQVPSDADAAALTYHYVIDGKKTDTSDSFLSLPDYTQGHIYTVKGWITDSAGKESAEQDITVVIDNPAGYNYDIRGGFPVTNQVYGGLYIQNDGTATIPPGYNRFGYEPIIKQDPWTADTSLTVQYQSR